MYYKYFGVIVTYHAFQQLGQVTEVQGSVISLLHPYFLLIYIDIAVIALLLVFNRRFRAWRIKLNVREPGRVVLSFFVLAIVLVAANVWENRASMNELKKAHSMGIVPYELFELASGLQEAVVVSAAPAEKAADVTPARIAEVKGIREAAVPKFASVAKGKNLIVIQLEAFQNFLIGARIDGVEVTPNLNALAGDTLYFPQFYQMVGQGNTADAEYVVNTSLYVPPHGAASQDFGNRQLPGMPRLMAANGYDTATFHTNDVKFWNRKEFYQALGFARYYDKEFFGNEDTVMFGASDEVLYAKTAQELLKMSGAGKPFYAQIISMSGHHPFHLPEGKIRFKLPERFTGTLAGDYLEAQNYADYALGQFIAELKRNGLWDDSVIVLYGDHMGVPIYSLDEKERKLMKEMIGGEYRSTEMLNIPLLLSVPGVSSDKFTDRTGGQVDILPTVANLLGIPLANQVVFGQDLLNQESNVLPERYYLPSGSYINDHGIFVSGEGFTDGTQFPFGDRPAGASDATLQEYQRALALLEMSDRYANSLPKRE
jgi:lipoteichoic acid synthase